MKALYFDCFSGISGDMTLGALIDTGLDPTELQDELKKLSLDSWHMEINKVLKQGLAGTQVKVITNDTKKERNINEILDIVNTSSLEDKIKNESSAILKRISEVESSIHGRPASELHLHELGGIDTIIDVVGAVIGLQKLKVEAVFSSPVHIGKGFVSCAHGLLPVPAPATAQLLSLANAPVYGRDIEAELTTPTGAAILTHFAKIYGDMPAIHIQNIGYGAGLKDLPIPNLLRVFIGTLMEEPSSSLYLQDSCVTIEANIDDMNPELYSYLMERLFQNGALDVYMIPIYMKKNRPGILLGVITANDAADTAIDLVLKETTTLGVRVHHNWRKTLPREELSVKTRYGEVKVKTAITDDKLTNISPEYDSCRELAEKSGVPLKEIYQEVWRAMLNQEPQRD